MTDDPVDDPIHEVDEDDEEEPSEREQLIEAAREEKESVYPQEGYALVEIDRRKPPGEALTKVAEYHNLEAVSLPPTKDHNDYVVYDSDGRAYTADDL